MSGSPELRAEVEAVAASAPHLYPGLSISLSQQPLSQGQHYQRLVEQLQQQGHDGEQTWLLLTDDDDLWHPQRSMMYAGALRAASHSADRDRVLAVVIPHHIDADAAHEAVSPMCVDLLVRKAAAVRSLVTPGEECMGSGEAWCYSMRLGTLAQFLAAADPCIVSHVYWDLCFVKFLRSGNRCMVAELQPALADECCMYFYRRDERVSPASRLAASKTTTAVPFVPEFMSETLTCVSNTLAVLCAQFSEFDFSLFAAQADNCTPNPKLNPLTAMLCRKLADEMLSDPSSIYYKLLQSCLPFHLRAAAAEEGNMLLETRTHAMAQL